MMRFLGVEAFLQAAIDVVLDLRDYDQFLVISVTKIVFQALVNNNISPEAAPPKLTEFCSSLRAKELGCLRSADQNGLALQAKLALRALDAWISLASGTTLPIDPGLSASLQVLSELAL